ncbi:ABC transporter ATP-binding protein [Lacunimicrobium album]
MSDVVIRVEGLGKKFKLGTSEPYYRLSEAIVGMARHAAAFPKRLFSSKTSSDASDNKPAHAPNEFWALKDINFEVKRGDVVGIIGRNGAGKSTLLKILSQITEPTEGRFGIKGRVASLLEVGTGFHPELTGRENIYLSGSILGMSKTEIKRKFDEITNFAGTDKFLDTPVKRYSSGMQVRLGFAIAAHLEPEILIVDEVLAVGDAEFQKKCLGKMGEVSKTGRTILFVSHNQSAMASLCTKGILLQNGEVLQQGTIAETLSTYQCHGPNETTTWEGPSGDSHLQLVRAWVTTQGAGNDWDTAEAVEIGAVLDVLQPVEGLIWGFRLLSSYGDELALTLFDDHLSDVAPTVYPQRMEHRWRIPPNTLASGRYEIAFLVGLAYRQVSHQLPQGELSFEMQNLTGLGRRYPLSKMRGNDSLLRPHWIPICDHDIESERQRR